MANAYIGALHIHTKYSDGTATIKEIAAAAKKAGLSWIIITDHNSLTGLNNDEEGWYDDVAVLIGEEITPEGSDHYLAFNIDQDISADDNPENYINEVKKQGGMGFIAHPDEKIKRKNQYKPLRWKNWNIQGFDGLEIWNYLSDWADNYDTSRIFHCYFRRNQILTGPTREVLEWWDNLNNSSSDIVPAVGGLDAHALDYRFMGINVKIFPYKSNLKTLVNRLYLDKELSGDFIKAKAQIYDAIKRGDLSESYLCRRA